MENSDADDYGRQTSMLILTSVPVEIIIYIAGYLPSKDILRLSVVCKQFNEIFNNTQYWRGKCLAFNLHKIRKAIIHEIKSNETIRLEDDIQYTNLKFPSVSIASEDKDYDWKVASFQREFLYDYWYNANDKLSKYTYRQESSVDVINLINNGEICVTGSRDRSFYIYDIRKMVHDRAEEKAIINISRGVHKGWIWTMSFANDQHFCSGGWDSWLKIWDLTSTEIQVVHSIKCQSAILCSKFQSRGLVAIGMYHKAVKLFDPRVSSLKATGQPSCCRKIHAGPVLNLAMDDSLLVTGSEDKSIAISDIRFMKAPTTTDGKLKCIKRIPIEGIPLCLSFDPYHLWIGDNSGKLHLLDPKDNFKIVGSFKSGHAYSIRGIKHRNGLLFTCSADRSLRVFDPTLPPRLVYAHKTTLGGEMVTLDYSNEILAVATADGAVHVWKKKEEPP